MSGKLSHYRSSERQGIGTAGLSPYDPGQPGGDVMIVELGHFALILALVVAVLQTVLPMYGAARRNGALMALAGPASVAQFLLIALSFGALTYAFVVSDFSLKLVVENSHTAKPMLYKVAGVWGCLAPVCIGLATTCQRR
jgi:hypothetical protein